MDQRFTKKERLQKRKEFQRVFDKGKVFSNDQTTIYALLNDDSVSRLEALLHESSGLAPVLLGVVVVSGEPGPGHCRYRE